MNRFFVSRFLWLTAPVIVFFKNLVLGAVLMLFLTACAYRLSNKVDSLPGNVKAIYVPMFKNKSTEPNVEVAFTDAMKTEMLRSGYASVVNDETSADAVLIGSIKSVDVLSDESVTEAKNTTYLPNETVLQTQSKVTVIVEVALKKKGSSEVLWSGEFTQSRNYTPPQVTLPVLNSANNLYNYSARRQTLDTLSKEMMQLAFDRLVDNF